MHRVWPTGNLHEPDSPPTYLENKECVLES